MKALQTPNRTSHKQMTLTNDKNTHCYASKRLKANSFESDKTCMVGGVWQPLTIWSGGVHLNVYLPISEFKTSSNQAAKIKYR